MISKIRGKIEHLGNNATGRQANFVIIDVGGIGFKVYVTADTIFEFSKNKADGEVSLWTHLAVKEDALDLYGFRNEQDLSFFGLLISISGIGPKKALSIMSIAPTETLKKAIGSRDASYLTQVSGVGKKNAEKIVLELKDKLKDFDEEGGGSLKEESDALLAIRSLGYTTSEAREALKGIPKNITGLSEKIKWALKELGK